MQKANHFKLKPAAKPLSERPERKSTATEQIGSKMTSPTLVEFRNQNAQMPEWRLQLQNAVQQRLKNAGSSEGASPAAAGSVSDAAAGTSAETAPAGAADNRYLSNALKRIESSRNRYLVTEQPKVPKRGPEPPRKDFPFTIAARTDDLPARVSEPVSETKQPEAPKPTLVKKKKSLPIKDLYDTSELDPQFPPAKLSSSFSAAPAARKEPESDRPAPSPEAKDPAGTPAEPAVPVREEPEPAAQPEVDEQIVEETKVAGIEQESIEEYDDYASLSLRFNAGFFDFLIGSFLSAVLLLPFVVAGGSWFTLTGLAAFGATCAIVMFVYLTASVGFAGKSFGMHIFSLEMIDIGGENYPTFHQSAVSAAVYLVSIACLGVGFVTALFDRDRRAAHDLLSGTLVVREL